MAAPIPSTSAATQTQPPATQDLFTFLYQGSKKTHQKMEETCLIQDLIKSRISLPNVLKLLHTFLTLSKTVEKTIGENSSCASLQFFDQSIFHTAERIEKDLKPLIADKLPISKKTAALTARIEEIGKSYPERLFAFAYLFYGGLLFGGQRTKKKLEEQYPELALTSLYDFGSKNDVRTTLKEFKDFIKACSFCEDTRAQLLVDLKWGFSQLAEIFEDNYIKPYEEPDTKQLDKAFITNYKESISQNIAFYLGAFLMRHPSFTIRNYTGDEGLVLEFLSGADCIATLSLREEAFASEKLTTLRYFGVSDDNQKTEALLAELLDAAENLIIEQNCNKASLELLARAARKADAKSLRAIHCFRCAPLQEHHIQALVEKSEGFECLDLAKVGDGTITPKLLEKINTAALQVLILDHSVCFAAHSPPSKKIQVSNLKSLSLSTTKASNAWMKYFISQTTNLEYLNLSYNPNIGDKSVKAISKKNVTILKLTNTGITDKSLGYIKTEAANSKTKTVDLLYNNALTNEGLKQFLTDKPYNLNLIIEQERLRQINFIGV